MEVEVFGYHRKLCHVLWMATRVRTDEIRDYLLSKSFFFVYLVEDALELIEQFERWFAHELQHTVGGVLWCYLQSSADMFCDKLACVLTCCLVALLVFALVQQQVVTHTTSYEALLYLWKGVNGMIDVEKFAVVGDEVRTNLWVYA